MKCDKRSERYFISEEGGKEETSFAWKVPRFRPLVLLILVELTCKSKVKFTLVQALRLCTGRTAHRGKRGIAPPFLDHGTRRG